MTAPRKGIQCLEVFHQTGSQWIQVDIPYQFVEIRGFLTQNGFVAILKKLPITLVFTIEPARVSGKKATHENGNGNSAGSQQQVNVRIEHCPGKTIDTCLWNQNRQPV
jgi:hypothetical protein